MNRQIINNDNASVILGKSWRNNKKCIESSIFYGSYCDFIKNYTLELQQNHIVSHEDNLVDKLKNAEGVLRGGLGFKF
jgi:hypothetical protein